MSQEQKEKIRQSNLGKKHKNSLEGKKRMLVNLKKGHGWNRGLKSSEEWRKRVRMVRLGTFATNETREKHRERMIIK